MPMPTLSLSNHHRQWAAWLYAQVTRGQRSHLRKQLTTAGQIPIAILFYHRVADTHPNPWTISRSNFARHLDWLESNFDVVSLAEAQRRIRSPHNTHPTVAITFDDGYAENCDFALPELMRRALPATYFVATESVAHGEPFAHDVKRGCPLRPNTIQEIQDIRRAGFEIGGHTRNHVDVGQLAHHDEIVDEVVGGIEDLEHWGAGPIRYFSFPFGLPKNTSQLAIDILGAAGIVGFCTAYGAWNWPDSTGVHLRRIHADPGIQTLKNWLTLDPRKLREHYQLPFHEPTWATPEEPHCAHTPSEGTCCEETQRQETYQPVSDCVAI